VLEHNKCRMRGYQPNSEPYGPTDCEPFKTSEGGENDSFPGFPFQDDPVLQIDNTATLNTP